MQEFVDGSRDPFVFHMCWTAGRTDKLKYMKNVALWFLAPKCHEGSWRAAKGPNGTFAHDLSTCCLADAKAWKVPTPYTDAIVLASK